MYNKLYLRIFFLLILILLNTRRLLLWDSNQKQPLEVFCRKSDLRDFARFTGKHLHRCFPVNFAKFLRTPFLQNTSGWLLLSNTKKSIAFKSQMEVWQNKQFSFIYPGLTRIINKLKQLYQLWRTLRSEAIFDNWKPFKSDENFSFTLKVLFVLKIFNFLSWLLGYVKKRLD